MRFKPEGNGAAENSLDGYKVLRVGDIAYEGHTSKVFSFGRFVLNDIGDGIMSPRFTTLRPRKLLNIFFWKQYIIYESIMKHILVKSTKLGTMMNELVLDDFFKCKIFVPSDNEQEMIGEFFKQLDHTITLHQQKYELLLKLKQAYLQLMFPQIGESTPQVRFTDFYDNWKQHKLGHHLVPYNEVTTENNQYPVFTSSRKGLFFQKDYYDGNQIASEDNTGYNIVPRGYFTYRHMSDDLIFKFNINDIADKGIVSTLYPVFTTTNGLDSKYLQYQLNEGREFKRFAILQKQGGSRTYMYLSKLKNLLISTPKYDEQKKISTFFKQLDETITLHQQKIASLKSLKQAYLQKMFV